MCKFITANKKFVASFNGLNDSPECVRERNYRANTKLADCEDVDIDHKTAVWVGKFNINKSLFRWE